MTQPDYETQKKLQNEAFLQKHYKLVTWLLIGFCLAIFILPWIFASFLTALLCQVVGALVLYMGGRALTTAFDSDSANSFWKAPRAKPKKQDNEN